LSESRSASHHTKTPTPTRNRYDHHQAHKFQHCSLLLALDLPHGCYEPEPPITAASANVLQTQCSRERPDVGGKREWAYLTRFHTTSPDPPPDAAATEYFS